MFTYVWRGIWHYRKLNLVVLCAVAISTTVIAGSLIVGDSIRHSLRTMTEQRLGRITHVLHSPRFVTERLTEDVAARLADERAEERAAPSKDGAAELSLAPAILLPSSIERVADGDSLRRAGSVSLTGLTDAGWQMLENGGLSAPGEREVILGWKTAQELNANQGQEVSIWVEIPSSIPRDSLLGDRDEVNVEIVATVAAVIPETVGASRFDLNPGQQLPYNAFVSLQTLQERLGLQEVVASRRNPVAKPARVNAILCGQTGNTDHTVSSLPTAEQLQKQQEQFDAAIRGAISLTDIGLTLRPIEDRGYVSVESEQMILEDAVSTAAVSAAEELGLAASPVLVYLANEIYAADRASDDERLSMYSIVAGVDTSSDAPLGPFAVTGESTAVSLADDEICLSAWLAADLQVKAGDEVSARWHEVGSHGELPEIEKTFRVKGVFAADDSVSVDRDLTPFVDGITNVESFGDWDQPFDMDMDRITTRDDDYWEEFRATPKAFVSLAAAEQLWKSRYGRYTSVRIALPPVSDQAAPADVEKQQTALRQRLESQIRSELQPAQMGLLFQPVLAMGLKASVGANDFTGLFIGFSFFLILSAVILASLMFRLGIQRRIAQLGVLNATGWPESRSLRLFATEGFVVSAAGSVLGAGGGIGFAKLMIYGLTTWWVGAVGTKFLELDIQPVKLVIAAVASSLLALFVIWTAMRSFRAVDIRQQLAGNTESTESAAGGGWWSRCVTLCGWTSLLVAVAVPVVVLLDAVPDGVAFEGITWPMVCFFAGGFACLIGGLFLLRLALVRRSRQQTIGGVASGIGRFALANAARNPMRSLLTTALIAFATFVIVAVGAGRRNPLSETPDKATGNGGFTLVAESAQPVLFDVNTDEGRRQLGLPEGADGLPAGTAVYSFGVRPGIDASCVNLYQATVPTLLGASDAFIQRGGFRFSNAREDNPWERLHEELDDTTIGETTVPTYPVIGDANTLQYSLKKRVGATIAVPDEDNPQYALKVVGMLDGSVFQGVLVLSDENLKTADADVVGSRYFLIEAESKAAATTASGILESGLNDYGFDAEPVSERLAGFLAVQNTYLSTFQMLGGLGLLVGTFGLAAVMVRNIVERRREIALLQAIGFPQRRIGRIIMMENNVLLIWGIGVGAASALLAMLPHLRSTGGDLPWQSLCLTLAAVLIVGMLACVFAVRTAAHISIRENLTSD
ncbi:MAG: FtsX-like permease family protein [Planctomycetaceae bacterium]|nr:FtsX-like permease family protein [Planctomycetaceae bacterium]